MMKVEVEVKAYVAKLGPNQSQSLGLNIVMVFVQWMYVKYSESCNGRNIMYER